MSASNALNDSSQEPQSQSADAGPKHSYSEFDLSMFTPEATVEVLKIDSEEKDRLYKAVHRRARRANAERVLREHVIQAAAGITDARTNPLLDFIGSGGWVLVGLAAGPVIAKSAFFVANPWLLNVGAVIGVLMAASHIAARIVARMR